MERLICHIFFFSKWLKFFHRKFISEVLYSQPQKDHSMYLTWELDSVTNSDLRGYAETLIGLIPIRSIPFDSLRSNFLQHSFFWLLILEWISLKLLSLRLFNSFRNRGWIISYCERLSFFCVGFMCIVKNKLNFLEWIFE